MIQFDVDEKRKKLQQILESENNRLAEEEKRIADENEKKKLERFEIARRLNELQKEKEDKEKKRSGVENELHLLQKESRLNEIMAAMRQQTYLQQELEKSKSDQILLIKKLELIQEERALRDNIDDKNFAATLEAYLPFAKSVEKYVPNATETVHSAIGVTSNDHNNITRELQNALLETYSNNIEEAGMQRTKLKQERFEIEAKIQQMNRKLQNLGIEKELPRSKTMEHVFQQAENMEEFVQKRIQVLNARLQDVQMDLEWMSSHRKTDAWEAMESRILYDFNHKMELKSSKENLMNYLKSASDREALSLSDIRQEQIELVALSVWKEIQSEVTSLLAIDVVSDCIMTRNICESLINDAFVEAMAFGKWDGLTSTLSTARDTGRLQLISGCMKEIRHHVNESHGLHATSTSSPRHDYRESIKIIRTQTPAGEWGIKSAVNDNQFLKEMKKIILLRTCFEQQYLSLQRSPLEEMEMAYFKKNIGAHKIDGKPLPLPPEIGSPSIIRIFSRASRMLSLLFVGGKTGRMAIWSVQWSQSTAVSPILIATTPSLPAREQCPITEIQETALGSSHILTLDAKGVVRIWWLNPLRTRSGHTFHMFPASGQEYHPVVPSCVVYITPLEYNMPDSSVKSGVSASKSLPQTGPQIGCFPQSVCIFPSTNICMRSSSILVGVSSGDVIKLNFDYKEGYFATPIVHLKAPSSATVEYMHSINSCNTDSDPFVISTKMVLGSRDPNKRGNHLYREVFHFHRTNVIFSAILRKLSKRFVTIDSDGNLAIWNYSDKFFLATAAFKPEKTALLDLRWKNIVKSPDARAPMLNEEMRNELKIHSRNTNSFGDLIEEFFSPSELLYQSSISKANLAADGRDPEDIPLDSNFRVWIPYKYKFSMRTGVVAAIEITPDAEEVVIVLTYTEPNGLGNLDERDMITDDDIEDGDPPDAQNARASKARSRAAVSSQQTSARAEDMLPKDSKLFAIIACLSLETLEFHSPVAEFALVSGEYVLAMSVGPVLEGTLTRIAFVQTTLGLRSFSLETGQELHSPRFPLKFPVSELGYLPTFGHICPLQKIGAFATTTDQSILVYALDAVSNPNDTAQAESNQNTEILSYKNFSQKILDSFKRVPKKLNDLLFRTRTITPKVVTTSNSTGLIISWLIDLVEEVIDTAMTAIDEVEKRNSLLRGMFGDKPLGRIEPTKWPIGKNQRINRLQDHEEGANPYELPKEGDFIDEDTEYDAEFREKDLAVALQKNAEEMLFSARSGNRSKSRSRRGSNRSGSYSGSSYDSYTSSSYTSSSYDSYSSSSDTEKILVDRGSKDLEPNSKILETNKSMDSNISATDVYGAAKMDADAKGMNVSDELATDTKPLLRSVVDPQESKRDMDGSGGGQNRSKSRSRRARKNSKSLEDNVDGKNDAQREFDPSKAMLTAVTAVMAATIVSKKHRHYPRIHHSAKHRNKSSGVIDASSNVAEKSSGRSSSSLPSPVEAVPSEDVRRKSDEKSEIKGRGSSAVDSGIVESERDEVQSTADLDANAIASDSSAQPKINGNIYEKDSLAKSDSHNDLQILDADITFAGSGGEGMLPPSLYRSDDDVKPEGESVNIKI